ncbi:hypothetical protein SAMN02746089_00929 [Caldanaerobius fijiensis DSM 17918]|uniref:DUF327 domain-containing protein n=1 Tax=Caldanaerobius fijiensis DSM 17918 TaxID=1121256 RepID=A0A1M4X2M4_9THEO|nr:YaaR family protein [Caldanaerobius fijiensis]SHE87637.1 hypothetical protein SAMN02746089_00929 [Caldanaerobius fijiensis DSM 17918]
MKVNPLTVNTVGTSGGSEVTKVNTSGGFEIEFYNAGQKIHAEKLRELLQRIDDVSKTLKENPDINTLVRYKRLVREFLAEVLNGFELSQRYSTDYSGRRKVYSIVKKVEEKLELMAQQFFRDQKDNLELIKLVDDIRGLLVDLYT